MNRRGFEALPCGRGFFLQNVKLEGSYKIPALRSVVWEHLHDPERLARCLPGCEKMEPEGPDAYRLEMKVGLAAIKGSYHGRIQVQNPQPPEKYRLMVEGHGAPGFLKGEGEIALAENSNETEIRYSGEVQVGGLIASVGQRLLQGAARLIVNHFFEALSRQIAASQ